MEISGQNISLQKFVELYGTLRNSTEMGRTQIWFELASQLDLNCSENVKQNNVKGCYWSKNIKQKTTMIKQ